ncbi:unnamed protein product [Euphydryas editha]|uniref:Sodium channel protein Nach n=1 Tax=Euphydryas editha TaxID=104508 RepID=A0AAU9UPT1_EUPED|nr:unnamed protein product [Euphydryas editha]
MKSFKVLRNICGSLSKRFIFFGRNSGIHGLKYVFEEKATRLSRLVWLLILLIFTGCLYLLLMPLVQRGNAIGFTPDTRYLHWTTTFPGVTVCESYIPKTALKKLSENYAVLLESLNYDYKRYISDLIFGRGVCIGSLCLPCGTRIPCDISWRNMIENIHKHCDELIVDCRFNGKKISCCESFRIVDSEYGPCYSFNSLQSNYFDDAKFIVNRSTGPGVLTFNLLADAQITIHSTEELSTDILDKKFKFEIITSVENHIDLLFSIIEVDDESLLQNEDISVRRCRYNHEIPKEPLHNYQVYSYGACHLAKSTAKAFQQCGCVQPVRDLSYKNIYCNYTGLNCLVTYKALKTKLDNRDEADADDCLPSCNESELNIIHVSKRWVKDQKSGAFVNIQMISLPTMRLRKNLLRTNLDLVVSVGGMVGLFFSASILSFAEIFCLIFRSP